MNVVVDIGFIFRKLDDDVFFVFVFVFDVCIVFAVVVVFVLDLLLVRLTSLATRQKRLDRLNLTPDDVQRARIAR